MSLEEILQEAINNWIVHSYKQVYTFTIVVFAFAIPLSLKCQYFYMFFKCLCARILYLFDLLYLLESLVRLYNNFSAFCFESD